MTEANIQLSLYKSWFNQSLLPFRWYRLHRKRDLSQFAEKSLPGVTILKPLVDSVDSSLFQNLETFFTLDYPKVSYYCLKGLLAVLVLDERLLLDLVLVYWHGISDFYELIALWQHAIF